MNVLLKIEMIIISLLTLGLIISKLKSKNMNTKYSILWLLLPIFFLIMALFSDFMIQIANKLGFVLLSNMIFFITVGILFIICFSLTIIVSNLNKRITQLTQEIALLKKVRK